VGEKVGKNGAMGGGIVEETPRERKGSLSAITKVFKEAV
jgi:hypothetical protein